MHLKKAGFIYVFVDYLLKIKKELKNLRKLEIQNIFTEMNWIKLCFRHDMAYEGFKDLARRRASAEVLRDKTFNIAKNPKYDGYQRGLGFMIYKFFEKKSKGGCAKSKIKRNQQLAEELHKPIIKKFFKKKSLFSI